MKVKNDHRSKFSNLSNWKEEAWKKIGASTGFEPVTSALPVRSSTNWAMKPHIGSEVNLLSSYLPWGDIIKSTVSSNKRKKKPWDYPWSRDKPSTRVIKPQNRHCRLVAAIEEIKNTQQMQINLVLTSFNEDLSILSWKCLVSFLFFVHLQTHFSS